MEPAEIAATLAAHAEWLESSGDAGSFADFTDADLRVADLSEANIRKADLSGADLRYADLRDANLRCADFRRANLTGADLRRADLRGANLDFSSWPLWCGSLGVTLDGRQQRQLVYHALAVSPAALARAPQELLDWVNQSHVITEHKCEPLVRA